MTDLEKEVIEAAIADYHACNELHVISTASAELASDLPSTTRRRGHVSIAHAAACETLATLAERVQALVYYRAQGAGK